MKNSADKIRNGILQEVATARDRNAARYISNGRSYRPAACARQIPTLRRRRRTAERFDPFVRVRSHPSFEPLFRAPIEASRVAIPVATPSYSACPHIRAVAGPQEPLLLGAVVFLFRHGLASLAGGIVSTRRCVRKRDQHQASRTDAGSHNSEEISPFHPIGSPSGRTALCIPIFASNSQDACELAHIAPRISRRDCACLSRIKRQNNIENRTT